MCILPCQPPPPIPLNPRTGKSIFTGLYSQYYDWTCLWFLPSLPFLPSCQSFPAIRAHHLHLCLLCSQFLCLVVGLMSRTCRPVVTRPAPPVACLLREYKSAFTSVLICLVFAPVVVVVESLSVLCVLIYQCCLLWFCLWVLGFCLLSSVVVVSLTFEHL